ncbi:MAG: hypothetical protein MUF58_03295 [Arcicella sp.]|nr:hypothetical protein [Arcicella sp.]
MACFLVLLFSRKADLPAGTVFRVYLSNSAGSFSSQTQIGSGTISPISVTFPTSVSSGTGYLIRIVSVSPVITSNVSSQLTTNGKYFSLIVNNLSGKEINYYPNICQGSALTGIINANQTGVSYEWKKDGIVQNTQASLRITQSGNYVASAQKTGCGTTVRNLSVNFRASTIYRDIVRVGARYQCSGGTIIFRSGYFSDSATYQWEKDGNLLLGETKDTLAVSQSGTYTVQSTDKCPISSNGSTVAREFEQVIFGNTIESQIRTFLDNGSTQLCGNALSISIGFGGGLNLINNPLNNYTYQWTKNGVPIPFANSNSLNSLRSEGVYNLILSQGNCSSISNGIELTRVDTIKLNLKTPPQYSTEICQGMQSQLQEITLTSIQKNLYKNGILYRSSVSGPMNISESGVYTIEGTSSGCTVLPSNPISISVNNNVKPILFTRNTNICIGQNTQFDVYTQGLSSPQYQWYRNNQLLSGYVMNSYTTNQSGYYKVKITSGLCTGFSDSVQVNTYSTLPKLKIYDEHGNIREGKLSICTNNTIRMYVKNRLAYSFELDNDSIFLKKNGIVIRKIYQGELALYAEEAGIYTIVRKQGTCLSPESDPVEIKIGEPITANITGSTSIYPGQKAKLNLNFTGGNAWSYQTSDVATGQTTSSSPTLKTVSPTSTQTYSITSVASNCGVGTVTGNATVTVLPCPTTQAISLNNGNWNTASTWVCGQIPTPTLDTIIEQGHTVNLPNGYQGNTKKLELKGNLTQVAGASVRVSN